MSTGVIVFIVISTIFFLSIFIPIIFLLLINAREMRRKNEIEEFKVKNDLYRIYTDISIANCEEVITNSMKSYLDRWVLINIVANGEDYIKSDKVDELIKYITTNFIAEMSDIHLFYIKCITNIDSDEALIKWVRNKTKSIVLDFITEYNQVQ
jgi:hypothetical protein